MAEWTPGAARQWAEKVDFTHELCDLVVSAALQLDPLDCHHLTRVEVQGAIDRAKLTTSDAVAELICHIRLASLSNNQLVFGTGRIATASSDG